MQTNIQHPSDTKKYTQFGTDPFIKYRSIKKMDRLTTVVALRYNKGILLFSDLQGSREIEGTRELMSKIKPISRYSLVGCSGTSSYINIFLRHVRTHITSEVENTFEHIDEAIQSYTSYLAERETRTHVSHVDANIEAIFVMADPESEQYNIYEVETPTPPDEYPNYAAIGSGAKYARHLLTIADRVLSMINYSWDKLTQEMVSQFGYLLLGRIITYELYSGLGIACYKLDRSGWTRLWDDDISPPEMLEGKRRYRIAKFMETLFNELPDEQLRSLTESYLDKKLLRKIVDRFGNLL